MQKLMRWCQVHNGADLPDIYRRAANPKKGTRRNLLQDVVNEAMEELGYSHDFPVTLKTTNKVFDLEWASCLIDDLSMGLNIFTLCWVVEEEAAGIKSKNAQSDQLQSSNAPASLADITTVLDNTDEVQIMRTLSELRFLVEQGHAFWMVLLGPYHPKVREYHRYRQHLVDHETELHRAFPRNKAVAHLVPALLAWRIQIDDNIWLRARARSAANDPVISMTNVLRDIDRKRDWAPELPPLNFLPPARSGDEALVGVMSGITMETDMQSTPTLATIQSQQSQILDLQQRLLDANRSSTVGTRTQQIVTSDFYNPIFDTFKYTGLKTRDVKDRCKKGNIRWPKVRGVDWCPSFHTKGMCNTCCGAGADHVAYTKEEDDILVAFLKAKWKIE